MCTICPPYFIFNFPLTHCSKHTGFLLFLEHIRLVPASGYLQVFPLIFKCFPLRYSYWFLHYLHIFTEITSQWGLLWLSYLTFQVPQNFHSWFLSFYFLYGTYHILYTVHFAYLFIDRSLISENVSSIRGEVFCLFLLLFIVTDTVFLYCLNYSCFLKYFLN